MFHYKSTQVLFSCTYKYSTLTWTRSPLAFSSMPTDFFWIMTRPNSSTGKAFRTISKQLTKQKWSSAPRTPSFPPDCQWTSGTAQNTTGLGRHLHGMCSQTSSTTALPSLENSSKTFGTEAKLPLAQTKPDPIPIANPKANQAPKLMPEHLDDWDAVQVSGRLSRIFWTFQHRIQYVPRRVPVSGGSRGISGNQRTSLTDTGLLRLPPPHRLLRKRIDFPPQPLPEQEEEIRFNCLPPPQIKDLCIFFF